MVKEFPESVKFVALLRRLNLAENIEGHLQYFSSESTVRYQRCTGHTYSLQSATYS